MILLATYTLVITIMSYCPIAPRSVLKARAILGRQGEKKQKKSVKCLKEDTTVKYDDAMSKSKGNNQLSSLFRQ